MVNSRVSHIPSLMVLGVAFLISGSISVFRRSAWNLPLLTLFVGIGGLFGYHYLYFQAFTLAPAVEANLINYLWPLFIVVLSPIFIQGISLNFRHVIAALMGLLGAGLIVSGGRFNLQTQYLTGYMLAFGAALTWAVYSLMSRRLPRFGTESVSVFCVISGILSITIFFISGGNIAQVNMLTISDWLLLVFIGIGPLGSAFYFWDAALKRGDPRSIGSLSYLTPLLSTLNLILFAGKTLTPVTIIAFILIIGGAVLGALASKQSG